MKRISPRFGTRCRLAAASLAALAAGAIVGCDDEETTPPVDGGTDSAVVDPGTDAGTDSGTTVTDAGTPDKNIVIVRLTTAGALDATYGTNGVASIDFGSTNDGLAGLAIHPDGTHVDKVVLFGTRTAPGATDGARIVARVHANGSGLDTAFATNGLHQFNLTGLSDNARTGIILADGSIVASGYTSQPTYAGMMSANRIVLVKLSDAGIPDENFGVEGIVNANPFVPTAGGETGMAEAYGVAATPTGFVTTGYGRVVSNTADFAVAQVNVAFTTSGALDASFGGFGFDNFPESFRGATVVQPTASLESRGRNIVALPGGRTLAVGSANTAASEKDVMVAVLDVDGNPNSIPFTNSATDSSTVGERRLVVAGGTDYADEACFGAAIAPNGSFAVIGGYRSQSGTDTDALLGILDIATNGSNETTGVTLRSLAAAELSTTDHDHFRAVAVSPDSTRIYATGFLGADAAKQIVVACFVAATGALCDDFGTGGFTTVSAAPDGLGIAVDSAGRVLVAGVRTDVL